MEHLSFDIICRIADEDMKQEEMAAHVTHWKSCRSCQQEIDLQRSIIKASRQTKLINPSAKFVQNVLDDIIPSQKKRWYKWVLHNMGNIIAMTSVLTFLGYVFSITGTITIQNDKSIKVGQILEFLKIIQDGSHRIWSYFTPNSLLQDTSAPQTHTILFALLALVLLVIIDQFADRFFQRSKVKS